MSSDKIARASALLIGFAVLFSMMVAAYSVVYHNDKPVLECEVYHSNGNLGNKCDEFKNE